MPAQELWVMPAHLADQPRHIRFVAAVSSAADGRSPPGAHAIVQGPPGTGKTRTLLALIALVCGAAQSQGAAFANDFGAQHI